MEIQNKPKMNCYGCKKEIGREKNLKCHFRKKRVHDLCAQKHLDKEDMVQAIANCESFSCLECLIQISPIEVPEDSSLVRMEVLTNTIGKLAMMEATESVKRKNSISR